MTILEKKNETIAFKNVVFLFVYRLIPRKISYIPGFVKTRSLLVRLVRVCE